MGKKTISENRNKLSVFEDESSIFVKGKTFGYGFDKKSGLISRLEVLGDDFLHGTDSEIPDIYISNARDPRESSYAAKYEDEAECDVISANPYEVHIRTHGMYHSPSGETFPVRYRITYEIQNDGTIFIIVHNKVYEPCVIRWLCISRGLLNPSLCKYFSNLADQSKIDTTDDYIFKQLPEVPAEGNAQDQALFSGRLIPWFWLGNDRTGVEICVWDVTHHRYGATQISDKMVDPLGEVGANISCVRQASGAVLWEIFSLRNLQTPVKEGLEEINYFALSVAPPKNYNPEFSGLRAYWAGPARYSASHKYLSDDEIKQLALTGYNLIIGGVNWHSGEYMPDDESEAKRVISTCHRYGMRIIPWVSLMDLSDDAEVFREYGPEWRIEPVVEYEYETHLMCPGSAGWREHWRQQIDRIAEDYDFDGLYLDLRYDKLACRSPEHGCQKRYMRPTFPWVRDMLKSARATFKTKDSDSVIVANTDILPISMICSWLDVRAVGASRDIRHVDRVKVKAFYSSHRLGCNSLMWLDPGQEIDHQITSLSLLYMAPIILDQKRSREEIELTLQYWNVLRFFGTTGATWYPGFVDDPEVVTSSPDLYVNVHRRVALLLTLANLSPDKVQADLSISNVEKLGLRNDRKYLIYEPISRRFLDDTAQWSCHDLKTISVAVPGYSSRLLYIREYTDHPVLLFALGSDGVQQELWDEDTAVLQFQLTAPDGADVSLAVHSPTGKPERIASAGEEIQFTWDEEQKLALFDIQASGVTTFISVNLRSV